MQGYDRSQIEPPDPPWDPQQPDEHYLWGVDQRFLRPDDTNPPTMSDNVGVMATDAPTEHAPKRKRDGRPDQPGAAPLVPDTGSDAGAGVLTDMDGSAAAAAKPKKGDMAAKRKAGTAATPTREAEPVAAEAIELPAKAGGAGGRVLANSPTASRPLFPISPGTKTKPHPVGAHWPRQILLLQPDCGFIRTAYRHTDAHCDHALPLAAWAMVRCYNMRFFAVCLGHTCMRLPNHVPHSTPTTPSCPANPPCPHCPPPAPRALCIKACSEGDCEGDSPGESARRYHGTGPGPRSPLASIRSFVITITIACRRRRDHGGKPTPSSSRPPVIASAAGFGGGWIGFAGFIMSCFHGCTRYLA